MDEFSKLKLKYDKNAIIARKFPVQPGTMKYPKKGLNPESNPLYMTNYTNNIGRLVPSKMEIAEKYYPINSHFTKEFVGGMYADEGLQTAKTISYIHKEFDGDI